MNIKTLKASILSNTIPNFLIFFIEEPALYRQYIHSISSTLGKDYEIYSTVKEAIYDIETGIKEDHLYVVFDDVCVCEEEIAKIARFNKNVILCYNCKQSELNLKNPHSLDAYKNNFVSFYKLDKDTLLAYAIKLCKTNKCAIEQEILVRLIDCCNNDLGIMVNELDKIFILEQSNSNVLVNYLLNEGFIDYRDVSLEDFVSAVVGKDTKKSINMLRKIDDPPVTILMFIYNYALNMLKTSRNIDYVYLLKLCFSLQKGIIDGTVSSDYAIEYLLYRWFR
jgi:hypothetical protein